MVGQARPGKARQAHLRVHWGGAVIGWAADPSALHRAQRPKLQAAPASVQVGGLPHMGRRAPSPQKPLGLSYTPAPMSDSHDQALARSQARRRRRIDHGELAKEREKAFYR